MTTANADVVDRHRKASWHSLEQVDVKLEDGELEAASQVLWEAAAHGVKAADDDVGYRLRAYVRYTDHWGNRVKAMTVSSRRVQPTTGLVFLLHVIPVDVDDLPDHRKQYGFEILDFRFEDFELRLADSDKSRIRQTERSVAVRGLPAYDIAAIRVGQYVPVAGGVKHIWEEEIRFPVGR